MIAKRCKHDCNIKILYSKDALPRFVQSLELFNAFLRIFSDAKDSFKGIQLIFDQSPTTCMHCNHPKFYSPCYAREIQTFLGLSGLCTAAVQESKTLPDLQNLNAVPFHFSSNQCQTIIHFLNLRFFLHLLVKFLIFHYPVVMPSPTPAL